MARQLLFVVEDGTQWNRVVKVLLELAWVDVRVAYSLAETREALEWGPDAVLLGRTLPDGDGITLLPLLMSTQPRPAVAIHSSLPAPATEIHPAVRYFQQPITPADLVAWYKALPSDDTKRPGGSGGGAPMSF